MELLMSCFWETFLVALGGSLAILGVIIGLVFLCSWLEEKFNIFISFIPIVLLILLLIATASYVSCL